MNRGGSMSCVPDSAKVVQMPPSEHNDGMSFQAYLDTITVRTGLGPEDFRALARERGLLEPGVRAGQIKDWLTADFDLGPGHAMALISILAPNERSAGSDAERIDALFSGTRARWRGTADALVAALRESGGEVILAPTKSYLSLVSAGRKFAIMQATGDRLDVGIKRKDVPPTDRFEAAGSWNSMVTHRVRIFDSTSLDAEVLEWLTLARGAS